MSRNIILYGLALAGLGIWLAVKLAKPKVQTVVVMQPAPESPKQELDEKELARLGLSGREQEVLQLMAEGLPSLLFLSGPGTFGTSITREWSPLARHSWSDWVFR